ncbi:MAG: hypothetical protein ACT4QE_01745 [Anaerolineales bacterium]
MTSIGFSVLAACAGLSLLATLALDSARYPGSMRVSDTHFDLLSTYKGYASQASVYQTEDDVMDVWRWYVQHFDVAPKYGMGGEGQCVRLDKMEQTLFLGRTVLVTLCSEAQGTQVFFNQMIYLPSNFPAR